MVADPRLRGRRLAATAIDVALALVGAVTIGAVAGEQAGLAVALVAPALLTASFLAVAGTTPGKRALDLAVVDQAGRTVSARQALRRELWGRLCLEHVLLLAGGAGAIGYGAGLRGDGRAWHDRVAGTRVIRRGAALPDPGLGPRHVDATTKPGPGGLEFAAFLPRAGAYAIDSALVATVWLLLFLPAAIFTDQVKLEGDEPVISEGFAFVAVATVPLLTALYAIVALYLRETTVGKHAVGLAVRRADGSRLSLRGCVMRELVGRQLTLGVAGALMTAGLATLVDLLFPLWNRERRSLHDMIGGSIVVRAAGRPRPTLDSGAPAADTDA